MNGSITLSLLYLKWCKYKNYRNSLYTEKVINRKYGLREVCYFSHVSFQCMLDRTRHKKHYDERIRK